MEQKGSHLPESFGKVFEQGRANIAEALARQHGDEDVERVLLSTLREQLPRLRNVAPAEVDNCLSYANVLEDQMHVLIRQRISQSLLGPEAVEVLLAPAATEIRQYHFVGKLALTFDYFDQRFLGATEAKNLRETIFDQGQIVEQALQELLGHIINEVLFDRSERRALRHAASSLAALRGLLAKPLEPSLLKADYTVRRRQFIRQAGWLCLRYYGHVTTDIMGRLLEAKQASYLQANYLWNVTATDDDDQALPRDTAINDGLQALRQKARKRSVAEDWETAAVIEAFFGKSHWKAWRPGEGAG